MITVSLVGFDGIGERLKTIANEKFAEVDEQIGASMQEMRLNAIKDAPIDQGTLRNEISFFQEKPLTWALISQASYSAFVEFGTKSHVVIPPGLEAEAAKFRGKLTSSISAKEAIFNWCKRHGIERKAWYAIFVKIMVEGVRPQPFFFKQLETERPNLLNRLQQIL